MRLAVTIISLMASVAPALAQDGTQAILQRFADDFAADSGFPKIVEFGVNVDDHWWTVRTDPSARKATVQSGRPTHPRFFFGMDSKLLGMLDRGEISIFTADGQTHSDDWKPLQTGVMEGYQPRPGDSGDYQRLMFSFWTRGQPKRISFGPASARNLHGVPGVLLYYAPGFRSVWHEIGPGSHLNAEQADQTRPFDTIFFVTKSGTAKARVNGRVIDLRKDEMIFIPAGQPKEVWNDGTEAADIIIVMIGEKA
jgi:mannose-6-phosphate isomerase-like protein (cupin superfamily)